MEAKTVSLGSSLADHSIQELATKPLTEVPPRYVRYNQDNPLICNANPSEEQLQLPIIDMQKLLSGDFMDSELEKLDLACKDWGFFQLMNHEVSNSLVENVKVEFQDFFSLPVEEKNKYRQLPGDIEGFGQLFIASEEQKLDWGYGFTLFTLPTHLRKPHLFPKLPLPFRMDLNYMKELFEDGVQSMRMNYYPPCPQPELVIGLNAHSDGSALTFLLQINEMNGLQIKKDGKWVLVKPLPDAFIVNIGDVLEIITNGIYRNIEHRAVVQSTKERLSFGTFCNPKLDGEFGPAPNFITPVTPALFKRISAIDHFKRFFSNELRGKSFIDSMRIETENSKSC